MRKRLFTILAALLVGLPTMMVLRPVTASPAETYTGTHFGDGNLPAGCVRDMSLNNPANDCYHMRTGMNGLDSPQVDVLVMVPVSPTAERDMRIMRQSVEMWEAGIDYMANQMGLDWLANGMDFHVTVDAVDLTGNTGGEFTTYPIVDPEIVIIASNPVGGIGIGIDPVANTTGPDTVPCHGVSNPFDFDAWDNMPGFERHHEARTGTYVEDCGGAGGDVCFAVNGAIDPAPEALDFFQLFDLVSHEFGHCLTIGHVGDGAEGSWGALPSNDIMAYSADPPGISKCVSSLDVESIAITMSRYLDVTGNGTIDSADHLEANDQIGDGSDAFQVQHPRDHSYASGTGSPLDCPQPDIGAVPGPRTEWTPTPVNSTTPVLTVTGPADGTTSDSGQFDVTGTVERRSVNTDPTEPTGSFDDADDDATTPLTEITSFNVGVTDTTVDATIHLADLWPSTTAASPTSYSILVNGRRFDSFVRYAVDNNPMTFDKSASAYMPKGTSVWDLTAKTVTFHIPRAYLADATNVSPYKVAALANVGSLAASSTDDRAPEGTTTVGVAAARVIGLSGPDVSANAQTVPFEHEGGNTFYPEESSFGVPSFLVSVGSRHTFTLDVAQTSTVAFHLDWTDTTDASDLDLWVTGAANSRSTGATASRPEAVVLENVKGFLDIEVEPYLIADPVDGVTYTLTAEVTPVGGGTDTDGDGVLDADDACPNAAGTSANGCPDTDGDGVDDGIDACPDVAGAGADGCVIVATEHVRVYVDGTLAATQDVDTANGPDTFDIPVTVDEGTHELRIDWDDEGRIKGTQTLSVTRNHVVVDGDGDGVEDSADVCPGFDDHADIDGDGIPDGCDTPSTTPTDSKDKDGDGWADDVDNCARVANRDQADVDGDGVGDACDADIDGDGWSNKKEADAGTDPRDPNSHPDRNGTAARAKE